jgi:antitoxin component of RelBE/YafQ-DinJ toxin-antitoxin module
MWLDTYRHGLNNSMQIPLREVLNLGETSSRKARYGISADDLDLHERMAEDFGVPFDEYMEKQQEVARRIGIPFSELVPWLMRKMAREAGIPDDQPLPSKPPRETITDPRRPQKPLPPGKVRGKTVLVSTMQDPRVAVGASTWVTRGWTYQEGVLSRRCLVFTNEQVYWECRGMAVNETVELPIPALHIPSKDGRSWIFADYMLSGIFRGDLNFAPELQFGFQSREEEDGDVRSQVKALDGHIRAYTARTLKWSDGSLKAFLGISAQYSRNAGYGLSLVLGIPIWTGPFADNQPGLQHGFAMSISA